jgi:hypothetical protein
MVASWDLGIGHDCIGFHFVLGVPTLITLAYDTYCGINALLATTERFIKLL